MRITLISDPDLVNSNYRAYQPLQVLSRRGHEVLLNRRGEPTIKLASALKSDALLIHRYVTREIQQLIEQAHAAGIGVVWDNDDDVTNVPRSNPRHRIYSGANKQQLVANLTRIVRSADIVTTPSERLAGMFRGAGATDVRVLENYLPPEFAGVGSLNHDGVTIVWLAGLEHQLDYQQLRLREALERLLDAYGDLRVVSIGLGLGLPVDRYEHVKMVDFLALARTMAVGDIGIAPLADVEWNRARSNIKLKEYAAAGLPWLASPVGAYVGLGEKQGGQLVADEGWYDALELLIVNTRLRRKLAKNAAKWAKGQSIEQHAHLWETALSDATRMARVR